MKQIVLSLAALLLCSLMHVQAQSTMRISKTDGTSIEVLVDEIEEVSFPADDALQIALPYRSFWLHPGQWLQLEAECSRQGTPQQADIKWQSSDPGVATVDARGRVTGVGDGSCQILALADGSVAKMSLNVVTRQQFDVNVFDIQNRSCSYTITPTDPTVTYYYNLRIQSGDFSVDSMDQYGSEEQNIYHFSIDWWDYVASMYGITWQEYMVETLTQGRISDDSSSTHDALVPGAQYCLYVFGMTPDGTLSTPIEGTKFQTTSPTAVDLTFEVTMDVIEQKYAKFSITPSNNEDPYFVNVQRASYVDWFVENDKMDTMVSDLTGTITPAMYPEAYCKGPVTRESSDFLNSLRADTDYYVILFGWDDGQTSPVTLVPFHTRK